MTNEPYADKAEWGSGQFKRTGRLAKESADNAHSLIVKKGLFLKRFFLKPCLIVRRIVILSGHFLCIEHIILRRVLAGTYTLDSACLYLHTGQCLLVLTHWTPLNVTTLGHINLIMFSGWFLLGHFRGNGHRMM